MYTFYIFSSLNQDYLFTGPSKCLFSLCWLRMQLFKRREQRLRCLRIQALRFCKFSIHSVMHDSLQIHVLYPARFLCPWNSPGKKTVVGIHSLLQGIFPTQGLNPGLLHCRQILYHLSYQRSPWGSIMRVKTFSRIIGPEPLVTTEDKTITK